MVVRVMVVMVVRVMVVMVKVKLNSECTYCY